MNQLQHSQQPTSKQYLGNIKLDFLDESEKVSIFNQQAKYLHSHLEYYEDFIDKLIVKFKSNPHSSASITALNAIVAASGASNCFILQNHQSTWGVKSQSDYTEIKAEDCEDVVIHSILPIINDEYIFNPAQFGIYSRYNDNQGASKVFIALPIKTVPKAEIMVVCGLVVSEYLTEVFGKIISSFYQASLLYKEVELLEASILDSLKFHYGFVSSSLYHKRFDLFSQRLKQMVMYFEPVLHIEPEDLFISGWEALARNPINHTAPSDLFTAAELWGSNFTVTLDKYFLDVACERYRHARESVQRRAGDVVPLSVNVYPESLMRMEYFETVRKIIKDKVISPRNLVLEISEKTDLPQFADGIRLKNPLQNFKKQLLEYVSKLKIRFAIDDFGVGYASVSRLAGLNPSHVKIDRELLYNHSSDIIIRFVHDLVGANNLNPAKVIVEGIDEKTPISLRSLREVGVSYIQGHLVGKPQPEVYRLSQDKYDDLRKRLLH
ncbi:EAL domain-containing protein [Dulcicalothrix desertica]|nr:EAL domain-containing protein [Dulcicalothrix desertica]TWH53380.1 EAL domain-containing protein (putative c-di-GMP-specific phosphodiesterase class I) [Dulcicalothrix desertica PCC 7102]